MMLDRQALDALAKQYPLMAANVERLHDTVAALGLETTTHGVTHIECACKCRWHGRRVALIQVEPRLPAARESLAAAGYAGAVFYMDLAVKNDEEGAASTEEFRVGLTRGPGAGRMLVQNHNAVAAWCTADELLHE